MWLLSHRRSGIPMTDEAMLSYDLYAPTYPIMKYVLLRVSHSQTSARGMLSGIFSTLLFALFIMMGNSAELRGQNAGSMFYSGDLNSSAAEPMTFREDSGTWLTTLQADAGDPNSGFLFRDSDSDFENLWSAGSAISFSTPQVALWQGAETQISVTNGRHYTFVLSDVDVDTDGTLIVHETSAAPVSIISVEDLSSRAVAPGQQAAVDVTLSAAPSTEEKVYIVYTSDNFATRSAVEVMGFGAPQALR